MRTQITLWFKRQRAVGSVVNWKLSIAESAERNHPQLPTCLRRASADGMVASVVHINPGS